MLCVIHATVLHGGFEFIEELLHAAWDCERQDSERHFQWVVERMMSGCIRTLLLNWLPMYEVKSIETFNRLYLMTVTPAACQGSGLMTVARNGAANISNTGA